MPSWSRQIPFKVDVVGVIEIMGTSLYSRADTPIRELIQNAHDAKMPPTSQRIISSNPDFPESGGACP